MIFNMLYNIEFYILLLTCHNCLSGHTEDFDAMLRHLLEKWPHTRVVAVGFSLGGNLVTKYLGEQRVRPSNLLGAISVCQGYCAIE
jgi:abhydrolase domain-containing protein 2